MLSGQSKSAIRGLKQMILQGELQEQVVHIAVLGYLGGGQDGYYAELPQNLRLLSPIGRVFFCFHPVHM